ncbi:NADPH oxidase regulator [Physcia stellaris]|nr:NADPH oxidase regulator [Physcia stellaris]
MSFLITKRALFTSAATASAAGAFYSTYSAAASPAKQKMLPAYEATFSVPLKCDDCIKDISSALEKLPGIQSTSFSLPTSMLTTTGTTPPSTIISTIQSTGRPAILRGSGRSNSAAVCILELPPTDPSSSERSIPTPNPVRGLIRLIQLSASSSTQADGTAEAVNEPLTLLDLTLTGLKPGTYSASLRTSGNISMGATSMGRVFGGLEGTRNGELGRVVVDEKGRGELVGEIAWPIWEAVGRGIVVQREDAGERATEIEGESQGMMWFGKTVWEEREEMVGKGML